MRTGSLRGRLTRITLSLLVVVLAVVLTAVALAYRASLQNDLRHHLLAAGTAVQRYGSATAAKQLVNGLALEGISTNIASAPQPPPTGKHAPRRPTPVKSGDLITSHGSLLVLAEVLKDGNVVTFGASSAGISRAVTRLLTVEIIAALAALALAAVLVLRGTRAALRPLSDVIDTATRIAAGSTELRLNPSRTDTELGNMAASFDRMVDALEGAVTSAQETEGAMRRFLADASHELRTPIAALQATAESLLREQPPRPRRDELEATLARYASHLGRLVDDLLSLARLEGSDRLPEETVDLGGLIREVVDEARADPSAPTIVLDLGEARVRGDANGLRRIVSNLLDNALAGVQQQGRIEIATSRRGADVEVRIVDDGPGVPPADRDRIFERFVRLNDTRTPGTGLGPAIARRIAHQHRGDLTCDDTPVGASFTLRVPASNP